MDYTKENLRIVFMVILFVIGVFLQIVGHRDEGVRGLMIQIISLAVLLFDLYIYNRKYK